MIIGDARDDSLDWNGHRHNDRKHCIWDFQKKEIEMLSLNLKAALSKERARLRQNRQAYVMAEKEMAHAYECLSCGDAFGYAQSMAKIASIAFNDSMAIMNDIANDKKNPSGFFEEDIPPMPKYLRP